MAAWQLTKALWKADVHDSEPITVTQPLHHAADGGVPDDFLAVGADQGLAVCPYSPLAGGFLTGKYERAEADDPTVVDAPDGSRVDLGGRFGDFVLSERGWAVLDAVTDVADDVNATPAQVALRWLMDREEFSCIPIVGARTVQQLDENVAACDVSLSSSQWKRIEEARVGATETS